MDESPDPETTKPELAALLFSNLYNTQRQLAQALGDMTLEEITEYQRLIAAQERVQKRR